jgi:TetR/AcrR family transcriptional regulator
MNSREEILKAADRLFGERGFEGTTTREIALESGVNKALIHYHFKNKDHLLEDILDSYYQRLTVTLRDSLDAEGPLIERMKSLVGSYVDFLAQNINFSRIVQREASGGKHLEQIRTHMLPLFQTGTGLLGGVFPQTLKGDMSAAHLLISFYGMVITYFTYSGVIEHLVDSDPLSEEMLEERKRHLIRMMEIALEAVEQ